MLYIDEIRKIEKQLKIKFPDYYIDYIYSSNEIIKNEIKWYIFGDDTRLFVGEDYFHKEMYLIYMLLYNVRVASNNMDAIPIDYEGRFIIGENVYQLKDGEVIDLEIEFDDYLDENGIVRSQPK
ncbi:hypothetical protein [Oceanivirga salmonicida]|uniref:hypothetical protein n=1 Tax=Oceanivirga salmonicida TaxID=1769291 RepID=UPI000835516B|nr:hypothetical protein [Oceanivirga salmonicida]